MNKFSLEEILMSGLILRVQQSRFTNELVKLLAQMAHREFH